MKKTENIKIPSQREEIPKVESVIEKINEEFCLPPEKFLNLQIAISEVLVNAIVHGNKENPDKNVYIELSFDENEFSINVRDEGTGFDINMIPDPTQDANLLKEHGRGIFIIKSLCDNLDFKSSAKGTEIKMTFRKK